MLSSTLTRTSVNRTILSRVMHMSTIITQATASTPSHRAALLAAEAANSSLELPSPPRTTIGGSSMIPVFTDLRSFREWRTQAFRDGKSVGFVPTMGALHEGHMSLVNRSLQENDLTVLSIFVNPAQFAPHEDLSSYPRTLDADLATLARTSFTHPSTPQMIRTPSAVFLPSVRDMYPSGIVQDVENQKGTFVEVKGYGHQMEGMSRPTFFRGVATVVTKLFNSVQPSNAYFGQKDIQQALIMRRMVRDLLLAHPTPQNLHIVPTHRSPTDGLALSSRNAYLSPIERSFAPTLFNALTEAQRAWENGSTRSACLRRANEIVGNAIVESEKKGVSMRSDYIEMNDPETFEVVDERMTVDEGKPVVLSGAVWVGKTRLIDNFLLGDCNGLLV
ncbi:pantothenate synthase [Tulasnella sp. JGI-2019a]|nr:pantothenate synthase [Tulasnella sp. JGI-2019a]